MLSENEYSVHNLAEVKFSLYMICEFYFSDDVERMLSRNVYKPPSDNDSFTKNILLNIISDLNYFFHFSLTPTVLIFSLGGWAAFTAVYVHTHAFLTVLTDLNEQQNWPTGLLLIDSLVLGIFIAVTKLHYEWCFP